MEIFEEISTLLQQGRAPKVKAAVQAALDAGANPQDILNNGLLAGMSVIGEKFKENKVFIPEVLVAARAMTAGVEVLKPHLVGVGVEPAGTAVIGTIKGDLHDIGKNLVKMMLEGKGINVIDLGTDVSPERFVQAAVDNNAEIICCSALLTTTMNGMRGVVEEAEKAGIREKVKIMVGGAPVTQEFCNSIGADFYTADAASAADVALGICKG